MIDLQKPAAGSPAAGFFAFARPFASCSAFDGGSSAAAQWDQDHEEFCSVLGRPGSDLLFQALRLSTIGAGEFNGRVRDGIGYRLPAKTTRSAKDGNGSPRCANGYPLTQKDFKAI